MHPPRAFELFLALVAWALVGCESDPTGVWVGELTESRSLAIIEDQRGSTAQVRRLGGGQTAGGVEVRIREGRDDRYSLTVRGCELELRSDDGEQLHVAGGSLCELTFEGWTGTFAVQGSGRIEGESLHLQLMGSTGGPGASGGFSWQFRGQRS